jgi:hypothetical protein
MSKGIIAALITVVGVIIAAIIALIPHFSGKKDKVIQSFYKISPRFARRNDKKKRLLSFHFFFVISTARRNLAFIFCYQSKRKGD